MWGEQDGNFTNSPLGHSRTARSLCHNEKKSERARRASSRWRKQAIDGFTRR